MESNLQTIQCLSYQDRFDPVPLSLAEHLRELRYLYLNITEIEDASRVTLFVERVPTAKLRQIQIDGKGAIMIASASEDDIPVWFERHPNLEVVQIGWSFNRKYSQWMREDLTRPVEVIGQNLKIVPRFKVRCFMSCSSTCWLTIGACNRWEPVFVTILRKGLT
jgi:hypothetical protein